MYILFIILLAQADPQPIIIGPLPPPVVVIEQPSEPTGSDAIYSPWQPEIREGATGSDAIYSPWK